MLSATLESTVLETAVKNSLDAWRSDLKFLLEHAKDRFPDVVWEHTEGSDLGLVQESIWGHKAIIYARTSPKRHAPRLYTDNNVWHSPLPYASISSKNDLTSKSFSLKVTLKPSVFLGPAGQPGTMVHLKAPPDHKTLVHNLREIYYALECNSEDDVKNGRSHLLSDSALGTLQQDLRFVWRAKLSSDIQLQVVLPCNKSNRMHTFWSHRFILASRSPYFLRKLERLAKAKKNSRISNDVQVLTLPSPLFTPHSLSSILQFIYTGTLTYYSKVSCLGHALDIYKGAKFLKIDSLMYEIRMRIVEESLHGLFSAVLPGEEYGLFVESKWRRMVELGGCVCKQCVGRVPRILRLTLSWEIEDEVLRHGARRAAVGMFGEGWCSPEFSELPKHLCDIIMNDMDEFINPDNFFDLLFASEKALHKLDNIPATWTNTVKNLVIDVRDMLDSVLLTQPEFCFECEEWMDIMHNDRIGELWEFQTREEESKWIFDAISRASHKNGAIKLHKALISSVLLRRHPTDNETLFLPLSSSIRNRINDLLEQFPPLKIDLPQPPSSRDDPILLSVENETDSHTLSSGVTEDHRRDILRLSVPESIDTYIYSYASSRTVSTDYGYYYTRRAPSMEMDSIDGENENLGPKISTIWSALTSSLDRYYTNYGITQSFRKSLRSNFRDVTL